VKLLKNNTVTPSTLLDYYYSFFSRVSLNRINHQCCYSTVGGKGKEEEEERSSKKNHFTMIPLHESLQKNEKLLRSIYSTETPTKKKKNTKSFFNFEELPLSPSSLKDNERKTPDSNIDNNNEDEYGFLLRRRVRRGQSDSAVGYYSDDEKRYRKLYSNGSEGEEQQQQEKEEHTPKRRLSIFNIPDFRASVDKGGYMFTPPGKRRPRSKPIESPWLIPVDHPVKVFWDLATVVVSFIVAYHSHTRVRDKSFGEYDSLISIFGEAWFLLDILFNFVSQIRTRGIVYKDYKSVWARYLTTWFIIDVISIIPWERHYVKPIVEIQKRRGLFRKVFSKSRVVVRVTTRFLRKRHVKTLGNIAKTTKHAGVGARRLLRLIIKYVPKYVFFYRRMKAIIVMRLLRQVHHLRKMIKTLYQSFNASYAATNTQTMTATTESKKAQMSSEAESKNNISNEDTVVTTAYSEEDDTMSLSTNFEEDDDNTLY